MVSTKQTVLRGPRDLHIEDRDLDNDNLGSHELWIDTEISALKIGTDRGNYEGAAYGLNEAAYPRFVGDSTVGIVRGVGSEVSRFEVGDRVAYRSGHGSGHIYDERRHIAKVPDEVEPEDAVWAHLYTLSGLCYRKANFAPGENVAVVGLGVLGLGAVALGPLFGGRVVGLANSPIRMEMAMKMGAHAAYLSDDPDLQAKLDEFTGGVGIDLVILTANPWPAYRTSVQIVRNGGRVSIVSLLGRGEPELDFNPLVLDWFYNYPSRSSPSVIGTIGEVVDREPRDAVEVAPIPGDDRVSSGQRGCGNEQVRCLDPLSLRSQLRIELSEHARGGEGRGEHRSRRQQRLGYWPTGPALGRSGRHGAAR